MVFKIENPVRRCTADRGIRNHNRLPEKRRGEKINFEGMEAAF